MIQICSGRSNACFYRGWWWESRIPSLKTLQKSPISLQNVFFLIGAFVKWTVACKEGYHSHYVVVRQVSGSFYVPCNPADPATRDAMKKDEVGETVMRTSLWNEDRLWCFKSDRFFLGILFITRELPLRYLQVQAMRQLARRNNRRRPTRPRILTPLFLFIGWAFVSICFPANVYLIGGS